MYVKLALILEGIFGKLKHTLLDVISLYFLMKGVLVCAETEVLKELYTYRYSCALYNPKNKLILAFLWQRMSIFWVKYNQGGKISAI